MKRKKAMLYICFCLLLLFPGCAAKEEPSFDRTESKHTEITTETANDSEAVSVVLEQETESIPIQTEDDLAEEILQTLTLEEKVAQLFIVTPEALTGVEGPVTRAGEMTKNAIKQYPVGGIIYFKGNIEGEEQVAEMIAAQQSYIKERLGIPFFIAVDEEGGSVARVAACDAIDVPVFSDMCKIGATENPDNAYEVGYEIGQYLSRLGFNLDFAPVADVLSNPENTVVKKRSFGSDPNLVSEMVRSELKGLSENGIYGCPKHFPGHGGTAADSHNGYAYSNRTWEELLENDLIPFTDAVEDEVRFIMVGHISLPNVTEEDLPASLSKEVITGKLRQELGYDGIVITDALGMGAISNTYSSAEACILAINAGVDLLLMPADFTSAYAGVLDAVKNQTISEERLDEAVTRIIAAKLRFM